MRQQPFGVQDFVRALPQEQIRLVRLCTRLTGDPNAAEDLTQETIVWAWRNLHKLYEPDALRLWLSAIARNMCRRWLRAQQRERARMVDIDRYSERDLDSLGLADAYDLERNLERAELAELLEGALTLLPPATRDALVAKYAWEHSHEQIASHLGMNTGAVTMRLQRGKLALRRILQGELREAAAGYGAPGGDLGAPQPTRIWCPICGQQHLDTQIDRGSGIARFRCRSCSCVPGTNVVYSCMPELLADVRSHKAILSRQLNALHALLTEGLREGSVRCIHCGRHAPIQRIPPSADRSSSAEWPGIYIRCM